MRFLRGLGLIVCIASFVACGDDSPSTVNLSNEETETPLFSTQLFSPDTALFRGFSLGDSVPLILAQEGTPSDEIQSEYTTSLIYAKAFTHVDIPLQTEIEFGIEQERLYSVRVTIVGQTQADIDEIWKVTKAKLDIRYGPSASDSEYASWYTEDAAENVVEISLVNASIERYRPELHLTYITQHQSYW